MIDDLDWREWLQRWSAEAIAHQEELGIDLSPHAVESGWLGYPPATAEQIAETEARLGRRLPPSLREFYSITNGWPVTSMEFGAIVPVQELGWYTDKEPAAFKIWAEAMDEFNEQAGHRSYRSILSRSVLVSDGSDQMLLDVGTNETEVEWTSFGLTSWYPGIDDEAPSFRAGLQGHYATFVDFDVPESATHQLVSAAVDTIYERLLSGDVDAAADLQHAPDYGSPRANALLGQINALRGAHRAWRPLSEAALFENDPAFEQDLWPMYVAGALNPRDPTQWRAIDDLLRQVPASTAALMRTLADRHRQGGGLQANYGGPFGSAIERARALARANDLPAAWTAYLAALNLWSPSSPQHLAPMALVWDVDLSQLYTHERGMQLLRTPRG